MRPWDARCSVPDGSVAVAARTCERQRRRQSPDRRDGAPLPAHGTAGTLVARRATRPV
ncbi:hypothetical protein ACWDXT_01235 [Streptomyces sp. NPDC003236]